MTPSEAKLAELEAIRRPLTEAEQREVLYLAKAVRAYANRRERMAESAYRQAYLDKKRAWNRLRYPAGQEARA